MVEVRFAANTSDVRESFDQSELVTQAELTNGSLTALAEPHQKQTIEISLNQTNFDGRSLFFCLKTVNNASVYSGLSNIAQANFVLPDEISLFVPPSANSTPKTISTTFGHPSTGTTANHTKPFQTYLPTQSQESSTSEQTSHATFSASSSGSSEHESDTTTETLESITSETTLPTSSSSHIPRTLQDVTTTQRTDRTIGSKDGRQRLTTDSLKTASTMWWVIGTLGLVALLLLLVTATISLQYIKLKKLDEESGIAMTQM